MNRAIEVYENQRPDQVLFRNQADRWSGEAATSAETDALTTYVAALDELLVTVGGVAGIAVAIEYLNRINAPAPA